MACAIVLQALLLVWLYIAVHGFAAPSGAASTQKWPSSWREAAGRLAAEGTHDAVLSGGDDLVTANMSAGAKLNFLSCKTWLLYVYLARLSNTAENLKTWLPMTQVLLCHCAIADTAMLPYCRFCKT